MVKKKINDNIDKSFYGLLSSIVVLCGCFFYSIYLTNSNMELVNSNIIEANNDYLDLKNAVDSVLSEQIVYNMYNPENSYKLNINGVYFYKDEYYCVKTKDRDWSDIKWTDTHENCHAFIDMDYQHFCNSSNQTSWNIEDYLK